MEEFLSFPFPQKANVYLETIIRKDCLEPAEDWYADDFLLHDDRIVISTDRLGSFYEPRRASKAKAGLIEMPESGSFIIADPGGCFYNGCGVALGKAGYGIKRLDFIHMDKSCHYNPFDYIYTDMDVAADAHAVINHSPDSFEDGLFLYGKRCEFALLSAVISYVRFFEKQENRNFHGVFKLLDDAAKGLEHGEVLLDQVFRDIEDRSPGSYAADQYNIFKCGAGHTMPDVIRSCADRLRILEKTEVTRLTGSDDLDFTSAGSEKTAVFVILPVHDTSFDLFGALACTQFFRLAQIQHTQTGFSGSEKT